VIRFGVVLTVVLAAMGLLAAGVLGNSLLLVYLAIGAAALAAVMLTVGVVIWREEVFGDSPAGHAGQAANQVAGPSPALAAVGGAAAASPAAGGPAAGPPPAALSRHPDRPEHQERLDWLERPDQAERLGRSERPERPERSGRERSERSERPERSERERSERPERPERSDRPEPQKLAEPAARLGSAVLGSSALRSATRSEAPPDATAARERSASAAEQDSPARREAAAAAGPRPQRALRSPSGSPPDPAPEPIPGPRRGDAPKSGEPAAADDILPRRRARREPAAESGSAAGIGAWSFFAKPTELPVTETDGGEAGGPAVAHDAAAGDGDVRDPGEPSEAAATADAAEAAPDAAHRPGAEPAASRDRATAEPAARSAPAEPARPEQASAAAEQGSAPDAGIAGLETTDEPADGSARDAPADSANGHGHAARDQGTEVTVVPGITRYHRGECILIRFLGPEDLETMTMQAAEATSYTPCRACRPEQQLAGD
jgi:hypothetical protein